MWIKRISRPWQAAVVLPKQHDAFYDSSPWRQLRRIKLKRDPFCEYCQAKGKIIHGKVIDHYLPRALWPELSLHPPNLRTCCDTCHQRKRNIEKRFKVKEVLISKLEEHGFK